MPAQTSAEGPSGHMPHLSLLLDRLGSFAARCLRGRRSDLSALGRLAEMRCSDLGEADARLLTHW